MDVSSPSAARANLSSGYMALNQGFDEDSCDSSVDHHEEESKFKTEPDNEADMTALSSPRDKESKPDRKWHLSQAVFPDRMAPATFDGRNDENSSQDGEFDSEDDFSHSQSTSDFIPHRMATDSDENPAEGEQSLDGLPSSSDDMQITKEYLKQCVNDQKTIIKSMREQMRRERRNRRRKELVNCPHCGKGMNRGSLSKHVNAHNREKRFHCSICGEKYDRYDYFQRHMAFHIDEKPYKCPECGKGFKEDRKMRKHLLTHTGEKPFICSLCNKAFSDSSALYKHLRSHKGEKPYECSICGKAFNESSKVVRHMRIHTGEKPFECPVCSRAFNDKSSRTKHIRTHKLELAEVNVETPLENRVNVETPFENRVDGETPLENKSQCGNSI